MITKHFVVTRFAIKWNHPNRKLAWNDWLKNSIHLMNTFCRPSLRNQTNQDFTLLSLVDDSVIEYGDTLPNEEILKVKSKNEVPKILNEYFLSFNYDSIIITRLDRDDCLEKKFIEMVKNNISYKNENYVDLRKSITYNSKNKSAHNSKKYFNIVSPFVSTHEFMGKKGIKCISLANDHDTVNRYLKGKKINELIAMQVIHDNNLKNKIQGEKNKINLNDFGIN